MVTATGLVGDTGIIDRVKVRAVENFLTKLIADKSIHVGLNAERVRIVCVPDALEDLVVEIQSVQMRGKAKLTQITDAITAFPLFLRGCQGRQKHAGQNRDDRNDDEQFNQR